MNPYTLYPNLWTPPYYPNLFVVKAPDSLTHLDEKTYYNLMQQRLSWMIETWVETYSPQSAQRLLADYVIRTEPAQFNPTLPDDLLDEVEMIYWRKGWAEAIISHNNTFKARLRLEAMGEKTFPAPLIPKTSPEHQGLLDLHESTNLSEWLSDLA